MVEPVTQQLRREFFEEPRLQRLQTSLEDLLRRQSKIELTDGRLIENVAISTTITEVVHGLGRVFRGWFVTRRSTSAVIFETTAQTDTSKFLSLVSSAGTPTVSLWVF